MEGGEEVTSELLPHRKVANAYTAWVACLCIITNAGKVIDSGIFSNWKTNLDNFEIELNLQNKQHIAPIMKNLFTIVTGGCAIVTNEALQDVFGKMNQSIVKTKEIDSVTSLRAIIYQIRNAYSHGMIYPKWDMKPEYEREYRIQDSDLNLDLNISLKGLNGKDFSINHIHRWWGFNKLISYALRQLEKLSTAPDS